MTEPDQSSVFSTCYPAGEASPVVIPDSTPEPRLATETSLLAGTVPASKSSRKPQYRRPTLLANPRPRSSWYSQPSVSYPRFTRISQHDPLLPPVPRLTPATLRSLETRFAVPESDNEVEEHYDDRLPWYVKETDGAIEDEDAVSPKATPPRRVSVDAYLSAGKQTAASQYLRDRAWMNEGPGKGGNDIPPTYHSHSSPGSNTYLVSPGIEQPSPHPFEAGRRESLSVTAQKILRRVSQLNGERAFHSGSLRHKSDSHDKSPLENGAENDDHRDRSKRKHSTSNYKSLLSAHPEHHKSSRTTIPHSHRAEVGTRPAEYPQSPKAHPRFRTPSLSRSSLSQFRRGSSVRQTRNPNKEDGKQNQLTTTTKHTNKTRDPFPPPPPPPPLPPPATIGTPYEKMPRGPSPIHILTLGALQTHPPTQPPPRQQKCNNHLASQNTTTTTTTPQAQRTTPPHLPPRRPAGLPRTDAGLWLHIGTMRGPTPTGLRRIHDAMARDVDAGGRGSGCKEVRRCLRYERRSVIEWVVAYVRGVWGVEV